MISHYKIKVTPRLRGRGEIEHACLCVCVCMRVHERGKRKGRREKEKATSNKTNKMTRILPVENKVQPDERKRTTKKKTGEKKEEIHTKAIGTIAFPKKKNDRSSLLAFKYA